MLLPAVFNSLDNARKTNRMHELLECNQVLKKRGLVLTPADAETIITVRSHTLNTYGRIELDINVTKTLISRLSDSGYVNQDNYTEIINDMYEVFHVLKNRTSDQVGDEEIIDAMMVYFNDYCGGSTDYLMGKGVEKILKNYHEKRNLNEICREEDESYWNWSE